VALGVQSSLHGKGHVAGPNVNFNLLPHNALESNVIFEVRAEPGSGGFALLL